MRPFAPLAAAALLMAAPAAALAHAHAKTTIPAADSTVVAPKAVEIGFSEAVNPTFTGAEITGADGKAVVTGRAAFDVRKTALTLPITSALSPGAYTVKWHAVAADTHRSQGAFTFTVKP